MELTMRSGWKNAIVSVVILLACTFPLEGASQHLRCELRANDHGGIRFSTDRSHLHFILFSDVAGLKVYEEWNSWGYYARSFLATDPESKTYRIARREGGWDKNFPSMNTLNKGEFLITDVYLCDGTWRVSPKLAAGPATLRLVGQFQIQASEDTTNAGVWTGQIDSSPVEVSLEKQCVMRLNAGTKP